LRSARRARESGPILRGDGFTTLRHLTAASGRLATILSREDGRPTRFFFIRDCLLQDTACYRHTVNPTWRRFISLDIAVVLMNKRPNEPVDLIPVPSGFSAYLLLIPLRGAGGMPKASRDRSLGTFANNMRTISRSVISF
jgi:hypothetical protein